MRRASMAALLAAALIVPSLAKAEGQAQQCADLDLRWEMSKAKLQTPQVTAMLFGAADAGCPQVAEKLLASGALIEGKDRFGNAPLAHAARTGQVNMLRVLLLHGAQIDHRNIAGSTALFVAAERKETEAALFLLDRGANPNLAGRSGIPPLAAAAFNRMDALAAALLKHGADPKTADATGKSPIVYAAAKGATAIVAALLDAGVPTDERYQNDLTALMWVAGYDAETPAADGAATAQLLLAHGAPLDAVDNRGRTALMMAAEAGHADMVKLLLGHGANAATKDKDGKVARDLAKDAATRAALGQG